VITLREARDTIHALEQQRLAFLTRKGRGELVRRFTANSLAISTVRAARNRVQMLPHRHAAILAGAYRLGERAVHDALTDLIDELLHTLADRNLDAATALDVLPAAGPPQPPEPPVIVEWRKGYFPADVDNQWARAWREANPVQAAAEAEYQRKLAVWRAQQRDDRDDRMRRWAGGRHCFQRA
jgi:hypothetical protein